MSVPETQTRLGRYEILRVLGQGAMGVVYEATDPVLNRPVAIKTILRNQLLDPTLAADSSARFIREAQAVARLNHPHIVTVFDFGEEGEVAYIVMEFIRGRELKNHFDVDDFFDLPQAIRIMTELLDALGYAHAQGVVHRDVKPANVMLDAGGRVKLTDFGVARLADSNHERTLAGTMVGTLSYMSPEQIQGMAVGSRADLFAAGIILYQFLTRTKPFPGPGQWTIQRQIVHEDPAPPSFTNSRIPPLFDRIIVRALAKDPAQRYASAAEFAADLKRALAGEPLGIDEDATQISLPAESGAQPNLRQAAGTGAEGRPQAGSSAEITPVLEKTVNLSADREKQPAAMREIRRETRGEAMPGEDAKAGQPARDQAVRPPTAGAAPRRLGIGVGVVVGVVAAAAAYLALFQRPLSPLPPLTPVPLESAPAPNAAAQALSVPVPNPMPAPKRDAVGEASDGPSPLALESSQVAKEAAKKAKAPAAAKSAAEQVAAAQEPQRTARSVAKASSSARCDAFLQRFQLGEDLSPEELAIFQKECKK